MKAQIITITIMFLSFTINAQNNNNYQYDNLNRLTKVTYPNGIIIDYTYDQLGNRTQKIINSVAASFPDLLVQNQSLSQTTIAVGASITATFFVANTGTGSSGGYYSKCYLSANQTYEQGTDIELGSVYNSGLAAGSNTQQNTGITIPQGTAPGNWYVLFFADATNLSTESNETNNISVLAITIVNCANIQTTSNITHATCGLNNGSVSITPSGGTAPYTYQWSNGSTNSTAANLAGNTYQITVTDFYGCIKTETATVNTITPPSITLSSVNATCGANNGSALVMVSDGTSPYSYLWSNGQTSSGINNITAGNYSVTVTDAHSCTVIGNVVINTPTNLSVSLHPTQPSCGSNNGIISASVIGGTQPYTYLWSNGQTGQVANNLIAGNYTITVTDANNCQFTSGISLQSINAMYLSTSTVNTTCGNANGTATVYVNNGTPPYIYTWSNGQNTQTAVNLTQGTYNVNVLDANNCNSNIYVVVASIIPPSVIISSSPTSCSNSNGSATANVNNGTPPYHYLWSNGAVSQTINNLSAGSYNVLITDNKGCITSSNVVISYDNQNLSFPTNGLLAYYPLNSNVNDSSGNGINGVITGNIVFNSQFASIASNGGSYITIPDNITFNNLKRLTILMKVFPSSFDLGCYNDAELLFGKGYDSQTNGYGIGVRRNANSSCGSATSFDSVKFDFRFKNYSVSTPFYMPNQWFSIAGVCDSNYIRIYINGVLIKEDTITSSLSGNNSPIYINRHTWWSSSHSERFGGNIDEIRLYNKALNINEINGVPNNIINFSLGNDTVLCSNQNLILNAGNGFSSYLWSNGNTSSIINLSGLNVGNQQYSVKVGACGFYSFDTINVMINPLPVAAGTVSGNANVCHGQNTIYTVPVIAYATSYLWSLPSGASGTSTTNSIDVSYGTSAISGNITVKGINSCGEGAISVFPINVNAIPATAVAITGPTNVCQGENSVVYFVPSISNATSYIWTLPNGATGTSTTNTISVNYGNSATSGNITVKGCNSCGEGSSTSIPITVNLLPGVAGPITGINNVCQMQNHVIYSVPLVTNASSYHWFLPQGVSGNSDSNSIIVDFMTTLSSGEVKVKGNNQCGNGSESSKQIIINPIPQTPIITQIGNTLYSSAVSGNQWYSLSNGLIQNATGQTYNPLQIGNYFSIVTLNGCSSDTSNILYYDNIGIGVLNQNQIYKVYPNPFKNELIIEMVKVKQKYYFEIFNSIGKLVKEGDLIEKTTISTQDFASGVYLIKIENDKVIEFVKIIKE